jgi:ATP-binding cassette, subfamily B, bacterial MsbA
MVERPSFLARAPQILRLARPPSWAGPAIITLGIVSAVLEGFGLVLFIPLLQSLGAPAGAAGPLGVFDKLRNSVPAAYLTAALVGVLCLSILLKNVVNMLNTWLTRKVDGLVAHGLRIKIFDQTLSSCIDYRAGMRRSDIATTLSNNSWKVSQGVALIYRFIISLLTFVVFSALMIAISPTLTLFALFFLGIVAMVIRFSTRKADATGQAVVAENKQFGMRMWESIESLQLIRAFGREDFEKDRFRHSSDQLRKRLLTLDLLWAVPAPISEIAITSLIGALILTAHSTGTGIAALAAFLSLLYRMQGPVRELMQSKVSIDGLAGAIDDVSHLLETSAAPFLLDGARDAVALGQGIALQNVWFRYGEDEPWALQDVSFNIPAGKTTAIVGESGAGKSTLLSLLFRFQDPTKGALTADGTPLTALRIATWRNQMALMSQDVQLFNATVAENIGYGRPGAALEDIKEAASIARASAFIEGLPDGYDTIVGDRGLRLSGGQRQRIALARTILRNPDLLLLDEATNALDVESEQAFQLALERFSHRRTVVVIAHRLSTVKDADQIIVMSKGRVIESGPPVELLRSKGPFARMFEMQQGVRGHA